MIPFLKGKSVNKKPVIIYSDFQVTISKWCIVNAPKSIKSTDISEILSNLAHEFLRKHFWIFHFFMCLVLILLFQQALAGIVGEKI